MKGREGDDKGYFGSKLFLSVRLIQLIDLIVVCHKQHKTRSYR